MTIRADPVPLLNVEETELARAIHDTEVFLGQPGCGWTFDSYTEDGPLCGCRSRAAAIMRDIRVQRKNR